MKLPATWSWEREGLDKEETVSENSKESKNDVYYSGVPNAATRDNQKAANEISSTKENNSGNNKNQHLLLYHCSGQSQNN